MSMAVTPSAKSGDWSNSVWPAFSRPSAESSSVSVVAVRACLVSAMALALALPIEAAISALRRRLPAARCGRRREIRAGAECRARTREDDDADGRIRRRAFEHVAECGHVCQIECIHPVGPIDRDPEDPAVHDHPETVGCDGGDGRQLPWCTHDASYLRGNRPARPGEGGRRKKPSSHANCC